MTRSYEDFAAPGEFSFRPRDNAAPLDDVVKFNWEMVRTSDGEVADRSPVHRGVNGSGGGQPVGQNRSTLLPSGSWRTA